MRNINDVINYLDFIIENYYKTSNTLGYFPILYKEITKTVQSKLNKN